MKLLAPKNFRLGFDFLTILANCQMPAVEEAKGDFACGGVENLPLLESCSRLSLGRADVQLEPRSLAVPELCLSLQPFVCSATEGHCWGDEGGVSLDWRGLAVQFGTG